MPAEALRPSFLLAQEGYPADGKLFQGWVLDVVLGGVLVREPVHDLGALAVGVVDLDERLPLIRKRVFGEDGLDGALRLAGPAVDAFLGIDDQDPLELVDAIDWADVDARAVFDVDAGLRDDVRHGSDERRVGKECRSRWSPYH